MLAGDRSLDYASNSLLGSLDIRMHRLTAKLLLLFAFVGTLAPLALALTGPPQHACCVRKAVHHCHESDGADTSRLLISGAGCCNGDCCRAVTTARWAYAHAAMNVLHERNISARADQLHQISFHAEVLELHSSRAPPGC
jgi:hypothetical protein